METIINKTADQITHNNNLHMQLVRAIGGKRIKHFACSCFAAADDAPSSVLHNDVMLIKNSRKLHFVDYSYPRGEIISFPLCEIHDYRYTIEGKNVSIQLFDGLYWTLTIELA